MQSACVSRSSLPCLSQHAGNSTRRTCAVISSARQSVLIRELSAARGLQTSNTFSGGHHFGRFNKNARRSILCRSFEGGSGSSKDPSLEDYAEVKVDSVRIVSGACVVYLRVLGGGGEIIPVHVGDYESNALMREINKQKQHRPLTHDVVRNLLQAIGYRITKVRITEILQNTYYARLHIGKPGCAAADEVDIDARPSDAINLAVRFGAPMYVNKKILQTNAVSHNEIYHANSETHAEIIRSVREALASYEDPTIMYQLQKELAIKEERFEDAKTFQSFINHEMTHNPVLRLVVAMEAALADARYEEAARLRDEYRRSISNKAATERT